MEYKEIISIIAFFVILAVIGMFFFNGFPQITGAAIADNTGSGMQAKAGFYATYSVKPNFRASIDYDFNEYRELAAFVKPLYAGCSKKADVFQCLKQTMEIYNQNKENPFAWDFDCREPEEKFFYDFVESYELCLSSGYPQGVCEFIVGNGPKGREVRIRAAKTPEGISFKLEGSEIEKKVASQKEIYALEGLDLKVKTPNELTLDFEFDANGALKGGNFRHTEMSSAASLGTRFLLYKDMQKDGNRIMFIEPDAYTSFDVLWKNSGDKRFAFFKISRQSYLICAKSKAYSYYIYEKKIKKSVQKNVEYMFALTYNDIAPPAVEGITVQDKLKDEKSLVVSWDRGNAEDVAKYMIFYSKDDFKAKEVKKGAIEGTMLAEAIVAQAIEIEDIDLGACSFKEIKKPCNYEKLNAPLASGKLYLSKSLNRYIFAIKDANIEESKPYYAMVVASDYNGNMINNKDEGQAFKLKNGLLPSGTSADDLAPGLITGIKNEFASGGKVTLSWGRDIKNLDGSDSTDIKSYKIYYKPNEGTAGARKGINIRDSSLKAIAVSEAGCANADTCRYSVSGLSHGQYLMGVTAIDKSNNEADNVYLDVFIV